MATQIKIGDYTITKAFNSLEYIVDGPDCSVIAQEYMLKEKLYEIIAACNFSKEKGDTGNDERETVK